VNNSKEKVKMGLFGYDSVPELNTINMGNSPNFLYVTHMTLSAKRFSNYGISKIDITADFCFWAELQLNETQLLGLGSAKTPEVPNIITVANSHIFVMVHHMDPKWLAIYELWLS
jgi:hypothetical protein